MFLKNLAVTSVLMAGLSGATQAATFDFESGTPAEFSGVGSIVNVGGLDGFNGFSGNMWRNTGGARDETQINLSGLDPHSTVTISFGLALIDSWDGTAGSIAPDFFNIVADSVEVFEISVEFFGPAVTESIPATATNRSTPGDVFGESWADNLFDVSITFAHSAPTLALRLFSDGSGWQGGSNENWAIDNFSVTTEPVNVVPLPAGAVLLLSGLGLLALRRRT